MSVSARPIPDETMRELDDALRMEFEILCAKRARVGAEEYGQFKYLGNDMYKMIIEELADMANYIRFLYVKIRLHQANLIDLKETEADASSADHPGTAFVGSASDGVPSDSSTFVPAAEVSGFLSAGEGLQDPR